MRGISSFSIGLTLLILIVLVCSVVFIAPDNARAQPALCVLLICKDAGPDGEGILFSFEEEQNGLVQEFGVESGGECHETSFFDSNNNLTVVENPTPGFVLGSVVCEGIDGDSITITEVNGGIEAQCNSSDEAVCTFVNVQGTTASSIPTLSEWGMIAAVLGLGFVGVLFAVRRRLLQAGA